jgi:hypothetical protein
MGGLHWDERDQVVQLGSGIMLATDETRRTSSNGRLEPARVVQLPRSQISGRSMQRASFEHVRGAHLIKGQYYQN